DYNTGLDLDSFQVVADFPLDGMAAGQNLAAKFAAKSASVWEWTLTRPLTELRRGKLTVSVRHRQGNVTRIERTVAVGGQPLRRAESTTRDEGALVEKANER